MQSKDEILVFREQQDGDGDFKMKIGTVHAALEELYVKLWGLKLIPVSMP
tara:strand:+ start:124 stop:273 length:150 start_codon:yes stop_codon:yes gene_type:complete